MARKYCYKTTENYTMYKTFALLRGALTFALRDNYSKLALYFSVVKTPDANKFEVKAAANNTAVKPEVETLLVKTRLRYGQLSDRDDDKMDRNEQWALPDELLSSISDRFKDVAEVDLEIYCLEETGVIRVKITDTTKNSLIYAIIDVVSNVIKWVLDNTCYIIQRVRGSEAEPEEVAVAEQSVDGFTMIDFTKRE